MPDEGDTLIKWVLCLPLMVHACASDRCGGFFFSWPVKCGETQTSGHLLLMNVKSKTDLFRKSKRFHTYDRAMSRERSNHPRHLVVCLCSCCQLCTPDRAEPWFGINDDECRMYEAVGRVLVFQGFNYYFFFSEFSVILSHTTLNWFHLATIKTTNSWHFQIIFHLIFHLHDDIVLKYKAECYCDDELKQIFPKKSILQQHKLNSIKYWTCFKCISTLH